MVVPDYIFLATPHSMYYDKSVFTETYAFLQESQWWSKEKLEEYQIQQFHELINHAYANVPYYRRVFDERGLKPRDIHNLEDLRKLLYLTKDIIRKHLKDLMATNYPVSKSHYATTGGSTGIPLGLYSERGVTEAKDRAFMPTHLNMVGDSGLEPLTSCV